MKNSQHLAQDCLAIYIWRKTNIWTKCFVKDKRKSERERELLLIRVLNRLSLASNAISWKLSSCKMLSQKVHFILQPCLILLSFNFLKIFLTHTFILKYSIRFLIRSSQFTLWIPNNLKDRNAMLWNILFPFEWSY